MFNPFPGKSFLPLMQCLHKSVPQAVWTGSRRNSKLRFMPEMNLDWNPVTFTVLGVVFSTDVLEIVTINFEN